MDVQVRQIDRARWVRDIPGEWTSGGHQLVVHLAGSDDVSPVQVTYPQGYDSSCGWCWLGATHSVDAHTSSVGVPTS